MHPYPVTSENGIGIPKIPGAEIDQSFATADSDMVMSKNMPQAPPGMMGVPTHHGQAHLPMYTAASRTALAGSLLACPVLVLLSSLSCCYFGLGNCKCFRNLHCMFRVSK